MSQSSTPEPAGIHLDARVVPFPGSITPEARVNLVRMVNPEGVAINSLQQVPALHDRQGWMALKKQVDGFYTKTLAAAAANLRLTVETVELGGATVHIATPETIGGDRRAYMELHGGALTFGGGEACRIGAGIHADQLGVRCYSVDYRTPPEHPYPEALDDCVATYRALLDEYAPGEIIVGGRSAGGNLAAATLLRARAEGLPLPGALVLVSPQIDLTESGDSFAVNAGLDVVLPQSLMAMNLLYAAGADLSDAYLSPLFGDLSGFPPTLLLTGTRDLFLSNTVRMHRRLREAGILAELHVFEAMPHGGFMGTPEDAQAAAEVSRFVREHWPRPCKQD
jgi:monoterpene epsilon-lactone hydrolase